jgi:hypothetical protein
MTRSLHCTNRRFACWTSIRVLTSDVAVAMGAFDDCLLTVYVSAGTCRCSRVGGGVLRAGCVSCVVREEVGEREGENTSGNSEMKECWQGYRYDGLTPSQAWVVIRPCISVCVCFCCWTAVDATMLIDAQIPFCSTSAVSWANCFSL